MTDTPTLIYIVDDLMKQRPVVRVYELDHDSKHVLHLKDRGVTTRMVKMGLHWFTSRAEVILYLRQHIERKIEVLQREIRKLRNMKDVPLRHILPTASPQGEMLSLEDLTS